VSNDAQEEIAQLRAFVDLVRRYEEHTRQCTACACGLYCCIETRQWNEIRKALYALGEADK
jgi:hypothetical protein